MYSAALQTSEPSYSVAQELLFSVKPQLVPNSSIPMYPHTWPQDTAQAQGSLCGFRDSMQEEGKLETVLATLGCFIEEHCETSFFIGVDYHNHLLTADSQLGSKLTSTSK